MDRLGRCVSYATTIRGNSGRGNLGMDVNKHLIWLIPLALAGCKKTEVEAQNASIAEVAQKMKETGVAQTTLNPGQWQATIKLDNIAAPGAPPEMEKGMRQSIGQTRTMLDCLTAENAKKPFERFVEGMSNDCKYDHFQMGGGKIDSKLVCTTQGMTRTMAMQGEYKPDAYKLQMTTEASGGTVKRVNMTMTLDAKRIGDCPKKTG